MEKKSVVLTSGANGSIVKYAEYSSVVCILHRFYVFVRILNRFYMNMSAYHSRKVYKKLTME